MRDMIQNHLLQILCMIAMSPPSDLTADSIRDAKVKVLKSLRRIDRSNVREKTVRGQYTAGFARGKKVRLSGRRGREQVQQHRDVCGDPRGYRRLALGRCAVLPAYRETSAGKMLRSGGLLQKSGTEPVQRILGRNCRRIN